MQLFIFKLILILNIIIISYNNIIFISNVYAIRYNKQNIIKNNFKNNLKKIKTHMNNYVCLIKNKIITKCDEFVENIDPLLFIILY
jgi:hypothetical protein